MKTYSINWKKMMAVVVMLSSLNACAWMNRLVYQLDLDQGNYIQKADVESLRYGMNKAQVEYVMGPPMLLDNGFPDAWYYVQWEKLSHESPTQKTLIVHFNDSGLVEKLTGDYVQGPRFYRPIGELD